mmetsp:Transcript_19054/g.50055  ORF Transcript_19054/g.50055 Transcript_19054/m.50055 type:complete len:213 (+) Transcript_19054:1471-2109(+)
MRGSFPLLVRTQPERPSPETRGVRSNGTETGATSPTCGRSTRWSSSLSGSWPAVPRTWTMAPFGWRGTTSSNTSTVWTSACYPRASTNYGLTRVRMSVCAAHSLAVSWGVHGFGAHAKAWRRCCASATVRTRTRPPRSRIWWQKAAALPPLSATSTSTCPRRRWCRCQFPPFGAHRRLAPGGLCCGCAGVPALRRLPAAVLLEAWSQVRPGR